MINPTEQLLAKYSAKTAERIVEPEVDDEHLLSYQQAAALLHCFMPGELKPLSAEHTHPNPFMLLHEDIISFSGGFAEGLYTLKPAVRTGALKKFSSRFEMRQGLEANPDRRQTPLQQMWEIYLETGILPEIPHLTYKQLINLYQIVTWLDGIETDLPDQVWLLALIKRKSVLANFEHLVVSNFTGREEELDWLREHINASIQESKPILSIYGSGGIGKSALVGKILHERATTPGKRLPYIYLAFDQPSLRIDKPVTILSEAAAQIELQYPELDYAVADFKEYVRMYNAGKFDHGSRSVIVSSREERINTNTRKDFDLFIEFADLLKAVSNIAAHENDGLENILLTFDTFEEVLYRDRESLVPFWNMLGIVFRAFPGLRVIIAGRGAIGTSRGETEFIIERSLNELKMPDRLSLLNRLGITNPDTCELIAARVGGNPLSLHLAARVITDNPDRDSLNEIIPESWLLFAIDEQLIQGQLYKRVLNHIHDADVATLAHPGMVLRKVTPEVILKVLAPVCEVNAQTMIQAERLFNELEKEHALVLQSEFDTLKYRPEIRQVMIRLLQQDKYEEVKKLHKAAIDYYQTKNDKPSRAEEMYHRLALDEDEIFELDSRWMAGIDQSIASTLDEYSDRMKAWLASKMSFEVDRSVFENASAIEWERNIIRKVKRMILNMDIGGARSFLQERTDRSPASPLYAIEAKVLLLDNHAEVADSVLDVGITEVSKSNNRGRLAELYWLKSQIAVWWGRELAADGFLQQAELAVKNASNPLTLIHIYCQRLLLHRSYPETFRDNDQALRLALSTACLRLSRNQKSVPGFIISLAIDSLGDEYPKTRARLEEYFPNYRDIAERRVGEERDMLVSENLRGLEKYREKWEGEDDDDDDRQLQAQFETYA